MLTAHTYTWVATLNPLEMLLLAVFGLLLVFLPALIAFSREHPNRLAILILDFLFGWTGIGWIILLIWSVENTTRRRDDPAARAL